MDPSGEVDPQNDIVSSQLSHLTGTLTLTSSLPTLPFELITEILCRLPVKFLFQLKCISKPWKSLISDPNFAKKHLRSSIKRHHLIVSTTNNLNENLFVDSTIPSVFTNPTITQTQLTFPNSDFLKNADPFTLCSCDGILCMTSIDLSAFLWNPTIQKLKILPPLKEVSSKQIHYFSLYSFGYDRFIDNYKVIVVTPCTPQNEVSVLTLGTDYWKRIQDFPYSGPIRGCASAVFVSGTTVNWLVGDANSISLRKIVSLDLEKESYQIIPKPDLKNDRWILRVLKDCLCIFAISDMLLDVWIMKEYGKKESWTKLYHVPYMVEHMGLCAYSGALYFSEEEQLLLDLLDRENSKLKLVVYDSKIGTYTIPEILEIQNINRWLNPELYIESLISPC